MERQRGLINFYKVLDFCLTCFAILIQIRRHTGTMLCAAVRGGSKKAVELLLNALAGSGGSHVSGSVQVCDFACCRV